MGSQHVEHGGAHDADVCFFRVGRRFCGVGAVADEGDGADDRDLGAIRGMEEPGLVGPCHDGGDEEAAVGKGERGERADDVDAAGVEADLLAGFAKRCVDDSAVARVGRSAREYELPGVVRQVGGAAGEQHLGSGGAIGEEDQDSGRSQHHRVRPLRCWRGGVGKPEQPRR